MTSGACAFYILRTELLYIVHRLFKKLFHLFFEIKSRFCIVINQQDHKKRNCSEGNQLFGYLHVSPITNSLNYPDTDETK